MTDQDKAFLNAVLNDLLDIGVRPMREETKEAIAAVLAHVEKSFPCPDRKRAQEEIERLFKEELDYQLSNVSSLTAANPASSVTDDSYAASTVDVMVDIFPPTA